MTQGLYDLPTLMFKYWWIIPMMIIVSWLYERRKQRLAQKEETEKER